jgi:hypothetical protein
VVLLNGAVACGVWWQVGSSATIGTTSAMAGNILALTSITMNTGATLGGRTLARQRRRDARQQRGHRVQRRSGSGSSGGGRPRARGGRGPAALDRTVLSLAGLMLLAVYRTAFSH